MHRDGPHADSGYRARCRLVGGTDTSGGLISTMRIKPTMRKEERMCTYRITVHVRTDDVIRALVYEHCVFGEPIDKVTRTRAMQITLRFLAQYGHSGWSSVDADMISDCGTACAVRIKELFPDLSDGADLSDWGIQKDA